MIEGQNKILQAFIATVLTWGSTAAGAGLVFIFSTGHFTGKRKILDFSLGFAAGVMTAASFWSLLSPAIDMAESSGIYGDRGQYAFGPCAIGFCLGGLFVLLTDLCIPHFATKDPSIALALHTSRKKKEHRSKCNTDDENMDIIDSKIDQDGNSENVEPLSDPADLQGKRSSKGSQASHMLIDYTVDAEKREKEKETTKKIEKFKSWKRILLLIIAITVHNIPEGLAVGISFGAIGSSKENTFKSARNLAIGMCFQNFPEGMAVSIPLCAAGYTPLKSFWYGQLSGLVEPFFGVLGAVIVSIAESILPYASPFAAGAMIYVVFDDIIPEAHMCGNGRIATWGAMVGFIIMMCLDVGLAKI